MDSFTPSINPYVSLVQTKPELILEFKDDSAANQMTLIDKLSSYSTVYLELGSGSGGHLLGQAIRSPNALFIGFEIRFKRAFRTIEKAEKQGIKNILIIRKEAESFPELLDGILIDGVYINFPDPWDKRRWLKNRLLTEKFLDQMVTSLKPGGFLSYKSDHPEYYNSVEQLIKHHPDLHLIEYSADLHANPNYMGVLSEFELMFKSKGVPVHYLCAKRR